MSNPLLQPLRRLIERRRIRRLQIPPGGKAIYRAWAQLRDTRPATPTAPVAFDLAGLKIHGLQRDLTQVFEDIFLQGIYQLELRAAAPVIFDCGANVGLATLFFHLLFPNAQITAFEPSPAVHEFLCRNIEGNDIHPVRIVPAACGKTTGTTILNIIAHASTGTSTAVKWEQTTATCSVPVVRVSDYVQTRVDLIKLDVEGAEDEVLEDLHETGALAQVDRLMIEYHHRLKCDARLSVFLRRLEDNGYLFNLGARREQSHRFNASHQNMMIYAWRPGAATV